MQQKLKKKNEYQLVNVQANIFKKYQCSQTCILVLTTSTGVFPKTLAAPATPPMQNVFIEPMSTLGSPP